MFWSNITNYKEVMTMLGKGAILCVFGFILAFSSLQFRMSKNVLSSSMNFNDQYLASVMHQTTMSGINMAVNKVWATNTTNDSYLMVANSCSCSTQISQVGLDTVRVKVKAWGYIYEAELRHEVKKADSIIAYFANSIPISEYFWFTNDEQGVSWITGDSVWGPVHTNGTIKTNGSPVFLNKVTAYLGISPDPSSSAAQFIGGWEVGVSNDIPTDMSYIINAATAGNGGAPINQKCMYNLPVTFDFQPDGSIYRTVQGFPTDTVLISAIAPENAIYSTQDIHVEGTFNGQLTMLSDQNIWIDNDLVYADNPLINLASDDLLGLVAQQNIYVTDNPANNSDVNLQACLMAVNGSFKAQNYSSRPVSGYLNLTGSVVQKNRGAVGTFSGGSIMTGFLKRYRFDDRLNDLTPPHYPFIKSLRLVAWWE